MEVAPKPGARPLTVLEASRRIREILEATFARLSVQGEVTGYKGRHASGHHYFSLAESDPAGGTARLDCVVWRSSRAAAGLDLRDGERVVVTGRVTGWSGSSRYQLVADRVERSGDGDLLRRLEELKRKLAEEGLFDAARKRPLPFLPRRIGVVTAARGAAVRDIVRTVLARWPSRILVTDVRVQGEGAAVEVAAGIAALNRIPDVDVIIVGRGGGSMEDLWAFNEEIVVRAVAASSKPVVSAVGHESDHVLTDDAADARAATPTAAAQLVVPSISEVRDGVSDLHARMRAALSRRVETAGQRLDDAEARLKAVGGRALAEPRRRVELLSARLAAAHPARRLAEERRRHEHAAARLAAIADRLLDRPRSSIEKLAFRLAPLSPFAPLDRGYALARTPDGRIVRSHDQVSRGDPVDVLLGAGALSCLVTDARPDRE
jgi:exodeoxyribonuclease VII large subunit